MPGLEDLYREIILDHYRNPRNRGELETPPAHRAEGFNPLCGDEIVVYLDVDDAGRISDIKIGGQGCSISQASTSMMSCVMRSPYAHRPSGAPGGHGHPGPPHVELRRLPLEAGLHDLVVGAASEQLLHQLSR